MFSRFQSCLLGLAAWCLVLPAAACSVPVFRYALEKWPSDPYQALVFHRGPLSAVEQALVRNLGPEGEAGRAHANVTVRSVDLTQSPPSALLELWKLQSGVSVPGVVLKFPSALGPRPPLWSGPLDATAVAQVIASPARREIVDRLAQGESVVWVLLESGDAGKDDAAAKFLDDRLNYLASTLKLPKLEAQDIADKLVSIPESELKLAFSSYRLSRRDADEQVFVQMLLATEADLKEVKEPIVFPIFGRGRSLYALVGKGINRDTVDRAASFMIGKCSCQVKEQNPGVDLLFAADWNTLVKSTGGDRPLPVFTNLPPAGPETVLIQGGGETNPHFVTISTTSGVAPLFGTSLSVAIGAGLVIVALGGLFLLFRK
jgi:hypothetical protein